MNLRAALRVGAVALAPLLIFPADVFATNGSLLIGYGAKSRGMGGVGTAYAQDSLSAAVNPAGIADVGTRVDAGIMVFLPKRDAWVPGFSGKDQIESDANTFLIPNMGGVYKFNRKMSIGFAAVGAGGGNTRYEENFFDFSGSPEPTLGVNLMQMVMSPSISYKLAKDHTIGFSPLIGIQSFRAYGLSAFKAAGFSSRPDEITNRGNDFSYGVGARLGWTSKFFKDRVSIGLAASSKVYMTKFRKYGGLFADNGSFDIPATYSAGIAIKPTKSITIAADYQFIDYSDVPAISNKGARFFLPLPPPDELLGQEDGLGFGWKNMKVYKLGVDYKHNDRWTYRIGYNYADMPIPRSQILFNTLAPATVEHHATVGFTYSPTRNSEWTFGLMRAFQSDLVAFNDFSGDNVRISMDQWAADLSYGFHF